MTPHSHVFCAKSRVEIMLATQKDELFPPVLPVRFFCVYRLCNRMSSHAKTSFKKSVFLSLFQDDHKRLLRSTVRLFLVNLKVTARH